MINIITRAESEKTGVAMYEGYFDGSVHVHIQDGNGKVGKGIYTVNTLPGGERVTLLGGAIIANIPGTCRGCCGSCAKACYAIRDLKRHNNSVAPSCIDNTLLMRHDMERFFREIQDFINGGIVSVIRYHAEGEWESVKQIESAIELARKNPGVVFYSYTKRYAFFRELYNRGVEIPDNFKVNISVWHNEPDNPYNFPVFIYDDTRDMESVFHCPAVDEKGNKTGVTCAMCKRCFTAKKGEKTAVYDH